jgi:putative flippase GtrA
MLKAKLTDRTTQVRFFRFVLVGGGVAAVHLGVLAIAKNYWPATTAYTAGFLVATAAHYTLNKLWALPSDRCDVARQLTEYMLTVGVSYLVNLGVFTFAHSILGWGIMWAAVCAVPPATLVVFLLLNFIVFPARP